MMTNPQVGQKVSYQGKNTHIMYVHPDGTTVTVYGVGSAFDCKYLSDPIEESKVPEKPRFTEAHMINYGAKVVRDMIKEGMGHRSITTHRARDSYKSWLSENYPQ